MKRYEELLQRVGKLPLDVRSLERLQNKLAAQLAARRHIEHFGKISTLVTDAEKGAKRFAELLDYIYKLPAAWTRQFVATSHHQLKPHWDAVHLIHEFGTRESIRKYNAELEKLEFPEFSLLKELGLELDLPPIEPLSLDPSAPIPIGDLVAQVKKHWHFLKDSGVCDTKVPPFEIIYEPSRFGLPQSEALREKRLRQHITFMKSLVNKYQPLSKEDMFFLMLVAREDAPLNPSYFSQERAELSPMEQKTRHKQLLLNERNIRMLYRFYVFKQFYTDGDLHKCPMKTLYD